MTKILVTGGAGYIGSHTVVTLIEQGYEPVILDNYSNSQPAVIDRVEQITSVRPTVINADIQDRSVLKALFGKHEFDSVIHFAGLKAVGESVSKPLKYYQNNVCGALTLIDVMREHDCFRLVFSSSATVYGNPASVPIRENFPLQVTNPYGQTKLMVENVLRDLYLADERWEVAILRYFNPVAAHASGLIGEDPNGIPNNDYDTADGTGVRDYIHVSDLAEAHIRALDKLSFGHACQAYNIGTGVGYSVLDVVKAFEKASGVNIPFDIIARRPGDVASCYADPSFSEAALGWKARFNLDHMMTDQWRWQSANPRGY